MSGRPILGTGLDSQVFLEYYYLKDELVNFCRQNNLQTTGSKIEPTDRIAHFLDTGEKTRKTYPSRTVSNTDKITLDALIEPDFVCSEKHRAFYKTQIGSRFSFNVAFQKWLKSHSGKTYRDSIAAYRQILKDKKRHQAPIDKQFEYNTYIRDFFAANHDKSLAQAIKCWKYKKSLPGHNRYDPSDLEVLQ